MGIFDLFTSRTCPECEKLKAELKKYQAQSSSAEVIAKSIANTIKSATAQADVKQRPGAFLLTSLHASKPGSDAEFKALVQTLQSYYTLVARQTHRFNGEVDHYSLFEVLNLFFSADCLAEALYTAQEIQAAAKGSFPLGLSQFLFGDAFFSSVMGDPEIRMDYFTFSPVLLDIQTTLPTLITPGRSQLVSDTVLREQLGTAFPGQPITEKILPSGRKVLQITFAS